jgi:putative hydrolase of the HAD superfamily
MLTQEPIQAVLFDYGMVLSGPPDPAAWIQMQALTGQDEATLQHTYWERRHEYDRGTLDGRAYWREIASSEAPHAVPEPLVDELIAADTILWTQPNQPMIEWALALQHAGIRTGILSNIGDAIAHGVQSTLPWISGFDHHTWSHTLKIAKPEPAIYAHAATGLETPAANILFIDDRADNIAAAAAAGMQTIHYSDHARFVEEMYARGFAYLLHPKNPAT